MQKHPVKKWLPGYDKPTIGRLQNDGKRYSYSNTKLLTDSYHNFLFCEESGASDAFYHKKSISMCMSKKPFFRNKSLARVSDIRFNSRPKKIDTPNQKEQGTKKISVISQSGSENSSELKSGRGTVERELDVRVPEPKYSQSHGRKL